MYRPAFLQSQPPAKRMRANANGTGAALNGEVRFADPMGAQQALAYNGTQFQGHTIGVALDGRSKDSTKVIVTGLPGGLPWADLKAYFSTCGVVKYAGTKSNVPITGTVRFGTAEQAQQALSLSGKVLGGHEVAMKLHQGSKDGTKLQIFNLPPTLEWQELKDFFSENGFSPVFVDVSSVDGVVSAEVRFDDPQAAMIAVQQLNGSILGGAEIKVAMDAASKDGSKVMVTGVPPGLEWQDVKDHFAQCGTVAFSKVDDGKGGAKGGGKGGGKAGLGALGGCGIASGCGGGNPQMQQMQMQMMQMMQMMQQQMGMPTGGMSAGGMMPAGGRMGKGGCGGGLGGGFGGGKGGGNNTGGAGGKKKGEVRFDFPMHAMMAVERLNGMKIQGSTIQCGLDVTSQDGSKLWVTGIPAGATWQDVKDLFGSVGQVAFAKVQ